jgi:hypothetical protein
VWSHIVAHSFLSPLRPLSVSPYRMCVVCVWCVCVVCVCVCVCVCQAGPASDGSVVMDADALKAMFGDNYNADIVGLFTRQVHLLGPI